MAAALVSPAFICDYFAINYKFYAIISVSAEKNKADSEPKTAAYRKWKFILLSCSMGNNPDY